MAAVLPVALAFAASACAVITAVALRSDRVTRTTTGRAFLAVAVSAGVWTGAVALQLGLRSNTAMALVGLLILAAVVSLSVAWPVFAIAYTGRTTWLQPQRLVAMAALPASVFVASLIPATRPLVGTNARVVEIAGSTFFHADPGALVYLFIGYTYLLDGIVLVLLVLDVAASSDARRRVSQLFAVAGGLPLAVSITSFMDNLVFDLTPVAFSITSVLIGYAYLRYDILDVDDRAKHQLVESVGDGYLVVDEDGGIVAMNDHARDIFDIDDPLSETLHVDDVLGEYPGIRAALTAGQHHTTDIVQSDGRSVTVYDATVESFDDYGIDGGVLLLRDVTDDRLSEKRARALLDRASTPVGILSVTGSFQYASPAYEAVLGYTPAELEDTSLFSYLHPDDRARVERVVERAIEDDDRVTVEGRFRTATGEWVVLECRVDPLFHDPYVRGLIVSCRDVTADRQARTRLQVVNRILRHDLRNDSNTITGYVDLLAESSKDPNADRYAGIVRARAQRLLDLGEKARIVDESARNPSQTTVDVSQRVRRAASNVAPQHPEVSLDVVTETDCVASVTPLVGTAFDNVIENAVCHNEGDTQHVDVSVERDGDQVVVTVADDGPRIPPSERRALRRGRETELEHTSGLGLWLAHWLVQESGGTLNISENAPEGNVVTIRLLAATDSPASGTVGSLESLDSDPVVGDAEASANGGRPVDETGFGSGSG